MRVPDEEEFDRSQLCVPPLGVKAAVKKTIASVARIGPLRTKVLDRDNGRKVCSSSAFPFIVVGEAQQCSWLMNSGGKLTGGLGVR